MRVAVVGAGLAGLTAAVDLVAAGADVVVLEARDRVGGRTHGIEVAPGRWADAGAAYLGARHTSLLELLESYGLKTAPTTMQGASRFDLSGGLTTTAGRFPPLNAVALGDLFDRLDALVGSVRTDAPWLTPGASTLDTTTVAQWARAKLRHPDAQRFLPLFLGEMMAADPSSVSVLHMAFYLRAGGGVGYLNAFEGGAQADRVDGGAHQLALALSERLDGRVHCGRAVRAIHQSHRGVTVLTSGGAGSGGAGSGGAGSGGAVEADAVVVALPPLLADALEYRPGLPARRASTRTRPGCAVKVHLVHPTPVWRDHGLSGWSVSDSGPLMSTVDDSPADGSVGVLTGFVTGRGADGFAHLPTVDQRAAALAHAARVFPELPPPVAVHVTDWTGEPYSRGCYAALFGPGDWLHHGRTLTTAHLRVHWAGTETSTEFFGLMEGAIRSGHRVANEILSHHHI
jgi:monoamine oxidase